MSTKSLCGKEAHCNTDICVLKQTNDVGNVSLFDFDWNADLNGMRTSAKRTARLRVQFMIINLKTFAN